MTPKERGKSSRKVAGKSLSQRLAERERWRKVRASNFEESVSQLSVAGESVKYTRTVKRVGLEQFYEAMRACQ